MVSQTLIPLTGSRAGLSVRATRTIRETTYKPAVKKTPKSLAKDLTLFQPLMMLPRKDCGLLWPSLWGVGPIFLVPHNCDGRPPPRFDIGI